MGGSAVPEDSEPTNDVFPRLRLSVSQCSAQAPPEGRTRGRVPLSDPVRPKSCFCDFEGLKSKHHLRVSYRALKVFPSPRILTASWSDSCVALSLSIINRMAGDYVD